MTELTDYRSAMLAVFQQMGQPGPTRPFPYLSQLIPCADEARAPAILHEYLATWPLGALALGAPAPHGFPLYPSDFNFSYMWCLMASDPTVDALAVPSHTRGGVFLVRGVPAQAFVHHDDERTVHMPTGLPPEEVRVVLAGDGMIVSPVLNWAAIHAAAPNTRTVILETYRLMMPSAVQTDAGGVLENLIFARPHEATFSTTMAVVHAVAQYVRWVLVPDGCDRWSLDDLTDQVAAAFACEGSALQGVVVWRENDKHNGAPTAESEARTPPELCEHVDIVHLGAWLPRKHEKELFNPRFGHWMVLKRRGVTVPAWPPASPERDTCIVRRGDHERARLVTAELWPAPPYESTHPPDTSSEASDDSDCSG